MPFDCIHGSASVYKRESYFIRQLVSDRHVASNVWRSRYIRPLLKGRHWVS